MAPVSLKFVVSFSSQDDRHPVANLLSGAGSKRWLSAPKHKTGQIEAVFELESPCVITHIDVGSVWCANIEVLVGRSSWPQGVPFKTLVPTANLMNPTDCRNSNGFIKTRMFNTSEFMEDVCQQYWDRLRVVCRQPFRKDVQFGLSFIRIKGNLQGNNNVQSPTANRNVSRSPSVSSPGSRDKTATYEKIVPKLNRKTTPSRTAELQNRLLKIAGSAENGTTSEVSLSRTARLVLAAADQSPKFSPTVPTDNNHKSRLISNSVGNRHEPSFKAQVRQFLSCLLLREDDLATITIADLRHRLEKRKRRKLTQEEKKKFFKLTQDFLRAKFENDADQADDKTNENDNSVSEVLATPIDRDSSIEYMNISEDTFEDENFSFSQIIEESDEVNDMNHLSPRRLQFPPEMRQFTPEMRQFTPEASPLRKVRNNQQTSSRFEIGKQSPYVRTTPLPGHSKASEPTPQQTGSESQPTSSTPYRKILKIKPGKSTTQGSRPSPDVTNTVPLQSRPDTHIEVLPEVPSSSPPFITPHRSVGGTQTAVVLNRLSSGDRVAPKSTNTPATDSTKRKSSAVRSSNAKRRKTEEEARVREVTIKLPSSTKKKSSSGTITILCVECRKMVPEPNFPLHQVRCKKVNKKSCTTQPVGRESGESECGVKTPVRSTPGNGRSARSTPQNGTPVIPIPVQGPPVMSTPVNGAPVPTPATPQRPRQQTRPGHRLTTTSITMDGWNDPDLPGLWRTVSCPICQQAFPPTLIDEHANLCAEISILA